MQNAPTPDWPPHNPNRNSWAIGRRMFLKHLSDMIRKEVTKERALKLADAIEEGDEDYVQLTFTALLDTGEVYPMLYCTRGVRSSLEDVFRGTGEMEWWVEPSLLARAFNTLPDGGDLRVLADHLAIEFLGFQERSTENNTTIFDADHPEGRDFTPEEEQQNEARAVYVEEVVRKLHERMVNRLLEPPNAPDATEV